MPELRVDTRTGALSAAPGSVAASQKPIGEKPDAEKPSPVDKNADFEIGPLVESERDWASIGGIAIGLVLVLSAMVLGGALPAYADLPAFLMVFGGTAAVTQISFSMEDTRNLPGILRTAFLRRHPDPSEAAMRLVALADKARGGGFFALERYLPQLGDDPFLVKSMALIVDNTDATTIESELRVELQATIQRHGRAAAMLRRAGEVAPAMGLIGTLIGLVQMLLNLDNPSSIGPAMAVAILATLYGAMLANMVLLPLAHKLERNTHAEALIANLTIMAAVSIAFQENPRRTEVVLNSILPPVDRIAFFD
ncbi:MAG TPA: MotA/TolQ/ExbB proton channel family protein [Stellaceae bacterium]|jgi:chemotaxis protein MotA|nr:MotA/TolQ/ExbB proton channel family protein [Stellaceae bacterium]